MRYQSSNLLWQKHKSKIVREPIAVEDKVIEDGVSGVIWTLFNLNRSVSGLSSGSKTVRAYFKVDGMATGPRVFRKRLNEGEPV